jgi:hypothetical protein
LLRIALGTVGPRRHNQDRNVPCRNRG